MFAKIFESIYDGTLAEHWQALVTFQQLLILCDEQGVIEMTPGAIHRRTGIPVDIIKLGIEVLEQPDPQSRSKDMEGRRIVRLDPNRDWGWFLVNHATYRAKITAEQKREADRVRIAEKRAAEKPSDTSPPVAGCREVSHEVAEVAYTDVDVERALSVGNTEKIDTRDPPNEPPTPRAEIGTRAGQAAKALRTAGLTHVNPTHPALLRLLEAGVTDAELADAATEAIAAGKRHIAYVCGVVEGRRRDAASAGAVNGKPKSTTGSGAHRPYVPERHRTRDGPSKAEAVAIGDIAKHLGLEKPAQPNP